MRRWFLFSLLMLTPALIAAVCGIAVIPETVTVVETVEVIKEVEVVKEVEVPATANEGPKEVIRFHDGGWDSLSILNAIAMHIIEHGYGYPVEQMSISVETMMVYLPLGDIHVSMEMWHDSKQEWYEDNVATGRLLDVGAVFESTAQGWYVPRYVIEGDPERGIEPVAPDLKSAADLPNYWEVFKDPEAPNKGLWVTCPVDWSCHKIMQVKAAFYDLDESFNAWVPNSGDDMNAAIVQAYERGEPVLTYYWEPNWILGKYDLIQLEEPEFTDECWTQLNVAIDQEPVGTVTQACAFPNFEIHTGVYSGLLDRTPQVVAFLNKMFIGTARLNILSAYMADNDIEPEDVAIHYLQTYENEWQSWVPAYVAEKVKTSLP